MWLAVAWAVLIPGCHARAIEESFGKLHLKEISRMARQFDVHGMAVTEFVNVDQPNNADKTEK